MRLDQYLFEQGLTESREKARALIMEGSVYRNGQKAEKAGIQVLPADDIELRGKKNPYVSRGGLKLEKALEVFPVSVAGKCCLDIGASTGGFTDCMLQNGAKHVYSVDVGYGQLDWKLRNSPQVTVMERTNFRHATADMFADTIEFFASDVSFISLKHIFPPLVAITAAGAEGVCLIKPQFEAGKESVGKNGVVKDPETHKRVILAVEKYSVECGFSSCGLDYSPVKGPKGNIEFLYWVRRDGLGTTLNPEAIESIVTASQQNL